MSFIGAGISHAAFGGIAIGFYRSESSCNGHYLFNCGGDRHRVYRKKRQDIRRRLDRNLLLRVNGSQDSACQSLKSYNVDLFGYLFREYPVNYQAISS
jgi:hypothetical protein